MYKVLKIGDTEYKLEYSFEAALYENCTETVLSIFRLMSSGRDQENLIKGMSNIPNTAIVIFYAGLLEHHGASGDGTVKSIKDAKNLAIQYLKSTEDGSFYKLMETCISQMGEDGFFGLIGLDQLMSIPEATQETQKVSKTPQDHKPKQTKKKTQTVSEM